jgi:hypothetical protein
MEQGLYDKLNAALSEEGTSLQTWLEDVAAKRVDGQAQPEASPHLGAARSKKVKLRKEAFEVYKAWRYKHRAHASDLQPFDGLREDWKRELVEAIQYKAGVTNTAAEYLALSCEDIHFGQEDIEGNVIIKPEEEAPEVNPQEPISPEELAHINATMSALTDPSNSVTEFEGHTHKPKESTDRQRKAAWDNADRTLGDDDAS